jgi:meiotically up-regulated gene 157 (Mug157) protein
MVWSGFRPSDDACTYGFLIPANMFATVVLKHVVTFAQQFFADDEMAQCAQQLHDEIAAGIAVHGIVEHPRYGKIYAYETDGYGQYMLMDDANVPSLLSLPYLGYCTPHDPLYQNTRRFVLSEDNPYYWTGRSGQGIGSPHTPARQIWPIALAMQGLTSTDAQERALLVRMLVETTASTGYMHESFFVDDPAIFTRSWFAWANSLFSEFILSLPGYRP